MVGTISSRTPTWKSRKGIIQRNGGDKFPHHKVLTGKAGPALTGRNSDMCYETRIRKFNEPYCRRELSVLSPFVEYNLALD